jgi:hypothetical protein
MHPGIAERAFRGVGPAGSPGRDPQALRAAACKEVPLLEGASHGFVSATITRSPRHPRGRLLGDILVSPAHHLALFNHPEVYEGLQGWL